MKSPKYTTITKVLWLLICSAWLMIPVNSSAQTVIGSWQTGGDDGWIDWGNGFSITNSANTNVYSFVSGAVSGYGQSLQIAESGNHQNLAIKLENLPGGMAAFLTNHLLSFTFSVPAAGSATAGFSQLYNLAINANGYGFVNQAAANFSATGATNNNSGGNNGLPNFYFSSGGAAQSQVVTLNYSNILSTIAASNTATSGYIELVFSFNNGGGAPTNYFINNVTLSGGSGTVVTNPPPPPPSTNVVIGSWQGIGSSLSSATDEGWIDWPTLDSITNPAVNPSIYSFVSGAVSGYGQSLQIAESGNHQNLAIKLENLPGGVAAFLTNHLLSFTFSVPAAGSATAGFSQLYQLAINASGYGFTGQSFANMTTTGNTNNNQSGQPNFYFSSGSPVQSQTVTLNYSNILSSITATPSSGYIELVFSFNNGGGAPTNYFINNVTLSGGSGTVITNPPPPPSTNGTVIGSWQGMGSALTNTVDEGWIDWPTLDSITNPAVYPSIYSFVSGAVSGYGQSLQIAESGNHQNLAIKLEYLPGGVAAFLTNHQLSFTFSVPSAAGSGATAGYSQLYAISLNASGYGFHDQSTNNYTTTGWTTNNLNGWQPNFNFYTGAPARSQVVTLEYSNILSSITATPTNGYVEIIFAFNNGGGAPTNYFINNVTLSGGPVAIVTNPPPPPSTVIGSWQGTGSALTNTMDEGWIDWTTLDSITNPAVYPSIYSFVSGAVSGYGQSLQITGPYRQGLSIKLENLPGGMAAFLTNHLLSFTFSVPATTGNAGYSQLYNLAINANGYGFVDQAAANFSATGDTNNNSHGNNGLPNFWFSNNGPAQSQVVTLNYSNILSAIAASNTATSGYIEIVFAFATGSGGPSNLFVNNVTLSGGSGIVVTNPPPPPATNSFTFSLLAGPDGSALNSSNGVFTWRPPVASAGTTNPVKVAVTENFAPNLSATNNYNVIVNPLTPTVISSITVSGGQLSLTVNGTQGPDYTLLASTNLVNWQLFNMIHAPVMPLTLAVPVSAANHAQFYRIQIGP